MSSPFPAKAKSILLAMPFVFLLVAWIGSALGFLSQSRSYEFEILIILFATTPHGILTLPIMRLREVREMIEERTLGRPWLFWAPVLIAFVAGYALFVYGQGSFGGGRNASLIADLLVTLLAYHHGIKQNLGISLIYNARVRRESELSAVEFAALARSERRERMYFGLLIPSYLLFLTCDLLRNLDGHPELVSLAKRMLVVPRWLTVASVAVILLDTAWIAISRTRDYEKLVYFGRLLLYGGVALGLSAVFMSGSLQATHATEYLGLCSTVLAKSRTSRNRKWVLLAGAFCLTTVLLPFLFVHHTYEDVAAIGPAFSSWVPLILWVAPIEGGLALMHYYLDRQIFRARIPAVRKNVLRLLDASS